MARPKPRVLVVDDDPLSVELILEFLAGGGYEIETAGDGREGWTRLEGRPEDFDVVLLDRIMPRMGGLELLRRIKKHPLLASLPVIMETSAGDRQEVVEGISAGAYYYLTKPFDADMLRSMVRAAVEDYERYRILQRDVRTSAGMLRLMRTGVFEFQTPEEATDLGGFLAKACHDPERVVIGLSELLINAVEHGNLEIGYEEKSELMRSGRWTEEIRRRLETERFARRVATARFERDRGRMRIVIRDEGPGFDPSPYLQIDPGRVFDSHGRGIAIANLLSFDEIQYLDGGREVVATVSCPDRAKG